MSRLILITVLAIAANAVNAAPTAFINVNVISMTEDLVVTGQTVIVDNGLIILIGPVDSTPVPEHSDIVDGTDRYLMPGLAEMHAHIPDARSADLDRVLTLFAANGVTTARGMLGRPSHLQLRQQ